MKSLKSLWRKLAKSAGLLFLIPSICFAVVVTAAQIEEAVKNSPYANDMIRQNAAAIAALSANMEVRNGETTTFNGSCCYGILQMTGTNIAALGMTKDQYRNASLQTQIDGWIRIQKPSFGAWAPQKLQQMANQGLTFDGRPITQSLILACVQLGVGHCETMIKAGRCEAWTDINGTSICKMADAIDNGSPGQSGASNASYLGSGLADFHFYERTFVELSNAVNQHIGITAEAVIEAIKPLVVTLLTIYIFWWGISMIRGQIDEPVTDGVERMVRISIITAIALQMGYYNGFLSDFLWNTPDTLASALNLDGGKTSAQHLDAFVTNVFNMGSKYYTWALANQKSPPIDIFGLVSIPDLSAWLSAWALWIFSIIASGYGAFLLALAKIALAMILGIGPLFVLALIFESTKRYFSLWIGQAVTFIAMVVLSASALKVMLPIMNLYLASVSGEVTQSPTLAQIVPVIAMCIVSLLVLMQVPSMAAGLGGGASIETLGRFALSMNIAGRAIAKFANAMRNPRQTLANMRANRRRRMVLARWAKRQAAR